MKTNIPKYQQLPGIKWLFVIAVLFNFSGYSNYTPPKTESAGVTLVYTQDQNTLKTVSYQQLLKKKKVYGYNRYETGSPILSLSLLHTNLTLVKIHHYQQVTPVTIKKIIIFTQHISHKEESPFHFILG
ncbi:hypothetical protein [Aquimarina sp. 2201CG5-10]|uniref:hypothetical protein n=1 Tax=Aquimarina callyspongiae TaxID=3098150 RepID=UPI002AB57BDE|nr:hypothetical protein [Aquimarina sp. 2201CG5-10]MDY8134278.1 hypothetical protein [Aquimarina sp. 2201CG5-10]